MISRVQMTNVYHFQIKKQSENSKPNGWFLSTYIISSQGSIYLKVKKKQFIMHIRQLSLSNTESSYFQQVQSPAGKFISLSD